MATPYVGEIRAFGFSFAPYQWAFCDGTNLPISQFEALYALIGNIYGGDGVSNFAVPNLQGRVPIHQAPSASTNPPFVTTLGQLQGTENFTLTDQTMPAHTHTITAAQAPSGGVVEVSAAPTPNSYLSETNVDGVWFNNPTSLNATAAGGAIGKTGGSQPHENMQPFLVINFCISLAGIYPSQT